MHVIAAKAVCFGECLKPSSRPTPARSSRFPALAAAMKARGYQIVAGGTDNHLFMVDLRGNLPELTAKKAQETLDLANITCNKKPVPFETAARSSLGHPPRHARRDHARPGGKGDGGNRRLHRRRPEGHRHARRSRRPREHETTRRGADGPLSLAV